MGVTPDPLNDNSLKILVILYKHVSIMLKYHQKIRIPSINCSPKAEIMEDSADAIKIICEALSSWYTSGASGIA
jgi:hypothetical protein